MAEAETLRRAYGRSGRHAKPAPAKPESAPQLATWMRILSRIAQAVRERGVEQLLILPHRELRLFPYWPLAEQSGVDTMVLAPSLTVAKACLDRHREADGSSLVVKDATGTLYWADRESDFFAQTRKCHGEVISVDRFASLTKRGPECAILHVAAHARYSPDNPYNSGFPLGPADQDPGVFAELSTPVFGHTPSPDPVENGYLLLTVAAIMEKISLEKCRLAVLSACESGVPRMHDGGEMTGLPNAFLLSGARSVIASLWPVDDRATYLLMRYLYEEWSGGAGTEPSPAVALTKARGRLKQTDRTTARCLLGEGAPLPSSEFPFDGPSFTDAFHCYGGW